MSYKLDLKAPTPTWERISNALDDRRAPKGGLVAYKGHLFLLAGGLCPLLGKTILIGSHLPNEFYDVFFNTEPHAIQMYDTTNDAWTNVGLSVSLHVSDAYVYSI